MSRTTTTTVYAWLLLAIPLAVHAQTTCTATWPLVDANDQYPDFLRFGLRKSEVSFSNPSQPPTGWVSGGPSTPVTGHTITYFGATLAVSDLWHFSSSTYYNVRTATMYPAWGGAGVLTLSYPCPGTPQPPTPVPTGAPCVSHTDCSARPCEETFCDQYTLRCSNSMRSQYTVCRAAVNGCDLPEYCTGTSPYCPPAQTQVCYPDTNGRGVTYWWSMLETAPNAITADAKCASLTYNGRAGRLAQSTSAVENTRLQAIKGTWTRAWLFGNRVAPGGSTSWKWRDGTVFFVQNAATIGGVCQAGKFCNWAANQPDNAGGLEWQIEMNPDGTWNDFPYLLSWEMPFFCEFPCATAADCTPGPCEVATCTSLGRCAYSTAPSTKVCRAAANGCDQPDYCSGTSTVCPAPTTQVCYPDKSITFWWSGAETTLFSGEAVTRCQSLSYNGRQGRLAQVTSATENVRLQTIKGTNSRAWIYGNSLSTPNHWALWDGTVFFVQNAVGSGGVCQPGRYCNWLVNQPDNANGVEHQLEMYLDGKWNDFPDQLAWAHSYFCEFPCATAADCTPAPGETATCNTALGRCVYSP